MEIAGYNHARGTVLRPVPLLDPALTATSWSLAWTTLPKSWQARSCLCNCPLWARPSPPVKSLPRWNRANVGTVYSPADGEITAVNEELEANPTIINADCYGKGWMYRIKPADMSQINTLIHGGKDVLEAWLQEDIKKFKKD